MGASGCSDRAREQRAAHFSKVRVKSERLAARDGEFTSSWPNEAQLGSWNARQLARRFFEASADASADASASQKIPWSVTTEHVIYVFSNLYSSLGSSYQASLIFVAADFDFSVVFLIFL